MTLVVPGWEVDFIAYKYRVSLKALILSVELEPLLGIDQRLPVVNVKHDDSTDRILEIAGDKRFEAFLPSCVPELQSI